MASQRIKGQEVTLIVTRGGVLESELTDVKSCEFAPQFEIKDQGYLGEKTNRKDDQYNGCNGSMEIHVHDGTIFAFLQSMKDRAQRNTPDVVFNISGIFSFPNGDTWTVTIPDAKFGATPISISDRGDYVSVKLEFAADDFQAVQN